MRAHRRAGDGARRRSGGNPHRHRDGLPGPETVGLVFARSGLAVKHGLTLSNGVGVIDSDYTGEIKVGLVNLSDKAYTIEPGERIAQLVIMPGAAAADRAGGSVGGDRTRDGRLWFDGKKITIVTNDNG